MIFEAQQAAEGRPMAGALGGILPRGGRRGEKIGREGLPFGPF